MIPRKPSPKRLSSPYNPGLPIEPNDSIDGPPKATRLLRLRLCHGSKLPTRARAEASDDDPRVVTAAIPDKGALCAPCSGSAAGGRPRGHKRKPWPERQRAPSAYSAAQNEVRLRAPAHESPIWMWSLWASV